MVAEVLADRSAWVRINAVGTDARRRRPRGRRRPRRRHPHTQGRVRRRRAMGPRPCPRHAADLRHRDRSRAHRRRRDRAGRRRPAPLARRRRPAARPRRQRRQPTDALRPLAPRRGLPRRRTRSRRSTASTRAWTTRPDCARRPSSRALSAFSASPRYTHGNWPSCTTSSPHPPRSSSGRRPCSTPSRQRAANRSSSQTANSSTSRSPTAPGAYWSWPPGCRSAPRPDSAWTISKPSKMEPAGIEPATSCLQSQGSLLPFYCRLSSDPAKWGRAGTGRVGLLPFAAFCRFHNASREPGGLQLVDPAVALGVEIPACA